MSHSTTKKTPAQSIDDDLPPSSTSGASSLSQKRYGGGESLSGSVKSDMEGSFGHSLSSVRIHQESGVAEAASARAVTKGSDIHFASGSYNPGESAGKFLLGHELTHVVQQGGTSGSQAKPESGATTTGAPALEAEADRVGHSVAAGASVVGTITGRVSATTAQHFEGDEHMAIGDAAAAGPKGEKQGVELAPDYRITFGEMSAMAGDYFASIGQMRAFAKNAGKGAESQEELEYIRLVKVHGKKEAAARFSSACKDSADKRYFQLAGKNIDHFVNPDAGDTGRDTADKADATRTETEVTRDGLFTKLASIEVPANAIAGYRKNHIQALCEAAAAGSKNESVETALAAEGFGQHFLNDSFAAGHLRAPRQSALDYWNTKVPLFFHNFKLYLAQCLAKYINDNDFWTGLVTINYIWGEARTSLENNLAKKGIPDFTFGDLVAGAIHDLDNQRGVMVEIEGVKQRMQGDAAMDAVTKKAAVGAAKAGVAEVRAAYEIGKTRASIDSVIARILGFMSDDLFRPEQMIPKVVDDADVGADDQSIKWDLPDATALVNDPKFQQALVLIIENKRDTLAEVGEGLEEESERDAFRNGIIPRMSGKRGIKTVLEIIHYSPDTESTLGANDENAIEYINHAKKNGHLGKLTKIQRHNLMVDLLTGPCVGADEDAVMDILRSADSGTAKTLIGEFGWKYLYDKIDDGPGEDFKEAFPKSTYGQ